jgi:Ala-tRNA(Pro) deacylase
MADDSSLPTSPDALMARLSAMGIAFTPYHHDAVFTCAQSGHLKEIIPGLHVRNLFLKDKKGQMALVVLPDDMSLDLKSFAPAAGLDRVSFGSAERLWQYLGVRPGSVCPFAAMNDTGAQVKVILDQSIAAAPLACGHPMVNTMSLTISGPDLVRFLESVAHPPHIMDLSVFPRQEAA